MTRKCCLARARIFEIVLGSLGFDPAKNMKTKIPNTKSADSCKRCYFGSVRLTNVKSNKEQSKRSITSAHSCGFSKTGFGSGLLLLPILVLLVLLVLVLDRFIPKLPCRIACMLWTAGFPSAAQLVGSTW